MEDQKIFNNEQVSWYDEGSERLDYELAFEKNGSPTTEKEKQKTAESDDKENERPDVMALLRQRDVKWKKRLKKAREVAYSKGFEEGKKEGAEQVRTEMTAKFESVERMFEQAHQAWVERHKALDPGLLDMVFELSEAVIGLPVENPEIRSTLESELSGLLHEAEDQIKPVLWVSERDYKFVEELIKKYNPQTSVDLRISQECNPGEFEFDTDKETVVHRFKKILNDFKESLSLPTWK